MNPVIQWVGGKSRLLSILNFMKPTNYNNYFESFLGGGALLFNMLPQNAYIYELNINIYNLYTNIKNEVNTIIEQLLIYEKEYLENTNRKEYYYEKRKLYNSLNYEQLETAILKTSLLLFLNKTCFNALYRENKKGEFNVPIGNMKDCKICNKDLLLKVSNYLNENNINIFNEDFTKLLDNINTGDFIYMDPPYYPLKKDSFTDYDKNGFNKDKHNELLDLVNILEEKKINFMLSNSNNTYFREKLENFNIYDISIARTLNSNKNDRKQKICEILVTNYKLNNIIEIEVKESNYNKININDKVICEYIKKKYILKSNVELFNIDKNLYNFIIINNINSIISNKFNKDNKYYITILFTDLN